MIEMGMVMRNFGSRISVIILGGALSLPALHAAQACSAGDLAGKWSKYASKFVTAASGDPETMFCNLTLTNASSSPIKYNITGGCKSYKTTTGTATNLIVSGSATLTETPACKLTGGYTLGGKHFAILDARIENGPVHRAINGIGRITVTADEDYQLFDFTLQR
jgi:hypothetical protein